MVFRSNLVKRIKIVSGCCVIYEDLLKSLKILARQWEC